MQAKGSEDGVEASRRSPVGKAAAAADEDGDDYYCCCAREGKRKDQMQRGHQEGRATETVTDHARLGMEAKRAT